MLEHQENRPSSAFSSSATFTSETLCPFPHPPAAAQSLSASPLYQKLLRTVVQAVHCAGTTTFAAGVEAALRSHPLPSLWILVWGERGLALKLIFPSPSHGAAAACLSLGAVDPFLTYACRGDRITWSFPPYGEILVPGLARCQYTGRSSNSSRLGPMPCGTHVHTRVHANPRPRL